MIFSTFLCFSNNKKGNKINSNICNDTNLIDAFIVYFKNHGNTDNDLLIGLSSKLSGYLLGRTRNILSH